MVRTCLRYLKIAFDCELRVGPGGCSTCPDYWTGNGCSGKELVSSLTSECPLTCLHSGGMPEDSCHVDACQCSEEWEGSLCHLCSLECLHGGVMATGRCHPSQCQECQDGWAGDLCGECSLECPPTQMMPQDSCALEACECSGNWTGVECSECSVKCSEGFRMPIGVCDSSLCQVDIVPTSEVPTHSDTSLSPSVTVPEDSTTNEDEENREEDSESPLLWFVGVILGGIAFILVSVVAVWQWKRYRIRRERQRKRSWGSQNELIDNQTPDWPDPENVQTYQAQIVTSRSISVDNSRPTSVNT